ncbi:gamma-glutamylcyclotransferase [Pseudoxanthobacter sp. M-2]|uniref:gamma-glutamylcyclotransferase n=1 Tax=Pseudoxanthobacter sp. M-2 TaxID=3078754 RepID=UPI0038FC206C
MGELWVFGYGSLIWRPGFPFLEAVPARLAGFHRSLCIYSHVHRGTPEQPGLVLGLDRGGSCLGRVFRVDAQHRDPTIAYLREREQATAVYLERHLPVTLLDGSARRVEAVAYVADRRHPQYAGRLDPERQIALVSTGIGQSGINRDYVLSTVAALTDLGIRDAALARIAAALAETATDRTAAE